MICYGQGGHKEQALRVAAVLNGNYELYSITDKGDQLKHSKLHLEVGELRDKKSGKVNLASLTHFREIYRFIKSNEIETVISLGPGCCILCLIISKILGLNTIHIESWSKFESLTLSGRVAKWLRIRVLVQNSELNTKYPNFENIGRL